MSVYTPKRAAINFTASGDTTLVAAVAGKRITVMSAVLISAASVVMSFKSAGTVIFGPVTLVGALPIGDGGSEWDTVLLRTAVGEALVVNCGTAVQVGGAITYMETN